MASSVIERYRVSVVIPNFNRKRDLERLLPSVANQTFIDYQVIVIDDFSSDQSAPRYIREFVKDHKNMCLVENPKNLGFVKTCNKGIQLANSEYICILTNDTEVDRNFIRRNVEIMDADMSIGVLSCIVVDGDGRIWFSGGSFSGGIPVNLREDFQGVRSVDFVAGTAPFYRKEVFEKIGLLNEDFVMYHEDVEFCLRVTRLTDYRSCVFGEKLIKHYAVQPRLASYKTVYYLHRNLILLLRRYSPRHIPKVLWLYVREVANFLLISILKLNPTYVFYASLISGSALAGLFKRQRGCPGTEPARAGRP